MLVITYNILLFQKLIFLTSLVEHRLRLVPYVNNSNYCLLEPIQKQYVLFGRHHRYSKLSTTHMHSHAGLVRTLDSVHLVAGRPLPYHLSTTALPVRSYCPNYLCSWTASMNLPKRIWQPCKIITWSYKQCYSLWAPTKQTFNLLSLNIVFWTSEIPPRVIPIFMLFY